MNPKFKFLFGDFTAINEEYGMKGKFLGLYFRDKAIENGTHPYYLFYAGMMESLYINDPAKF